MTLIVKLEERPGDNLEAPRSQKCEDCAEARRGCMPTFVFSMEGQISFRAALAHVAECRKQECIELRRKVLTGMRKKLLGLFSESVILGCVHIQPSIYGVRTMRLKRHNFTSVAEHLAKCPKESCACLRRSLMLSVRDEVSPNARQ